MSKMEKDNITAYKNLYYYRGVGKQYCKTNGTDHYKNGNVEPLDLIIQQGLIKDFALGSIIKYATRFKHTRNLDDLRKIADYAHILCGFEIENITFDARD